MKKLLLTALVLAALAAALGHWHHTRVAPRHLAAVPVIRKHLPEAHKHVSRVPGLPHRP